MKLPQDRTERIKILALAAIGAIAVVIILVAFVFKPLLARKADRREEIAKMRELLDAANHDVNRMMQDRDQNIEVVASIVNDANTAGYILQPRLGNYELGAHAYIDNIAQAVGLTVDSVREIGITQMPQPVKDKTERVLKCYNLQVSLNAGLHDLIRFLKAVEDDNPYLCISRLSISSRTEDPGKHLVSLDLQWPIWSDPTMGQQLEKRLEEARAFVPTTARPAS